MDVGDIRPTKERSAGETLGSQSRSLQRQSVGSSLATGGFGRVRQRDRTKGKAERVDLTTVVILSVLAGLAIVFILCADRLQVG